MDFWTIFRTIGALLLVLGLMVAVVFLLKKFMFQNSFFPNSNVEMKIISTLPLQQRKSIYLIKVASKFFVIGVSENAISFLSEINDESISNAVENKNNINKKFSEYFVESLGFTKQRKKVSEVEKENLQ